NGVSSATSARVSPVPGGSRPPLLTALLSLFCPCPGRFFTQKDVKRHLVVHTGMRNFACPYCTQRFGRKDHLVRHAKKSHNQDTRSFRRRNAESSTRTTTNTNATTLA